MDAKDLTTQTVAGAVAGDLAVSGIKLNDSIISVQDMSGAFINIRDEFTVTADGVINNIGGTSTNGHTVLVIWHKNYGRRHKFETGTGRSGRSAY